MFEAVSELDFRAGLLRKSCVGVVIVAVVAGRPNLAVTSLAFDASGSSLLMIRALEMLAVRAGLSARAGYEVCRLGKEGELNCSAT